MRERKIPQKPNNVYGNRNPVEIIQEDRRRILGKEREPPKQTVPSVPQPLEQVPGPSSDVPMNCYNDAPLDIEEEVAKLAQEGGVDFVNYLLAKAIPEADANKSLPTLSAPRECYRLDITLPLSLHCPILLVLSLCPFGHCFLPLSIVPFHCPLSLPIVHCPCPLSIVPLSLPYHCPIVLLYLLYIVPTVYIL